MAIPDLPSVVRVAAEGIYQGEAFVNVFHFYWAEAPAGPLQSDMEDLLNNLGANTSFSRSLVNLYELMDADLEVTQLVATNYDTTTPIQATKTVSLNGASSGTDQAALLNVVVQWRTTYASRRYRGRTFLPGANVGMGETGDPDRLEAGFRTAAATAAQGFVDAWAADTDWSFIIFSRTAAEATELPYVAEITSGSINPIWGVQRRRRPKL